MSMSARYLRPVNMRVRAPRVPFDLEVESRTIGTDASYKLATVDVSRSGLLLSWNRHTKVPFIVNTIVEMTIDPAGSYLRGPMTCLGKVVRREEKVCRNGPPQIRFGIQIVQIDNYDLQAWEGCVIELERRYGIEAKNKISQAS